MFFYGKLSCHPPPPSPSQYGVFCESYWVYKTQKLGPADAIWNIHRIFAINCLKNSIFIVEMTPMGWSVEAIQLYIKIALPSTLLRCKVNDLENWMICVLHRCDTLMVDHLRAEILFKNLNKISGEGGRSTSKNISSCKETFWKSVEWDI